MAILNVGPTITQAGIRDAIVQFVGTVDLLKGREQAISAFLTSVTDADLIGLGFTQAEVSFIRGGIAAFDQMVTSGLSNPTIAAFAAATRNFGL